MSATLSYLLARLSEPSTWAGIAAGAAAIGTALGSGMTLTGSLFAGVVAFLIPEKKGS